MDATPATILLVEDHIVTRQFLAENLMSDGYCILEAPDLSTGEKLIESAYPDLVIVDLGLPDGDGLDLVARVRECGRIAPGVDPDLPVLVLSARGGDLARLRGFRAGADDYVTKPFGYPELLARVGALLRRAQRRPGGGRLRVGALEVDTPARKAWLRGEPLSLSRKEFGLLRLLASDPDRVFTRDEIMRAVWGFQHRSPSRTIDTHAHRLRRKLGGAGDAFIVNVWGVGFRLAEEETK